MKISHPALTQPLLSWLRKMSMMMRNSIMKKTTMKNTMISHQIHSPKLMVTPFRRSSGRAACEVRRAPR